VGPTIGAGEFKARCLHLLDVVAERHEEVIITKRGRPVAKLVPVPTDTPLFGALAGSVARQDDLVSPTGAAWDADA
jgi:prevent-host-death family protein